MSVYEENSGIVTAQVLKFTRALWDATALLTSYLKLNAWVW